MRYGFFGMLAMALFTAQVANAAGISTSGNGRIEINADAENEPEVTLVGGRLPYDWKSCSTDSDCVSVNVGCGEVAVNKEHSGSYDKILSSMGLKNDLSGCPHMPGMQVPMMITSKLACSSTMIHKSQINIDPAFLKDHPDTKIVSSLPKPEYEHPYCMIQMQMPPHASAGAHMMVQTPATPAAPANTATPNNSGTTSR